MKIHHAPILLFLLAACSGGGASNSLSPAQTKMLKCAASVGISGKMKTKYEFSNGVETHTVLPGGDVTKAQANAANQCIARG